MKMYRSDDFLYRDRARQLIALGGLSRGGKQPTDIDACFEWEDKAVIFLEYKYDGALMPLGQRLCLERLTNDIERAGKFAIALLCIHNVDDTAEDVKAEDAKVRAMYYKGRWIDGDGSTVGQYVDRILDYVEGKTHDEKAYGRG